MSAKGSSRKPITYDEDKFNELLELYLRYEINGTQFATKLNVSRSAIDVILHSKGIKRPKVRNPYKDEEYRKGIFQKYANNEIKLREVCSILGISEQRVSQLMAQYKIVKKELTIPDELVTKLENAEMTLEELSRILKIHYQTAGRLVRNQGINYKRKICKYIPTTKPSITISKIDIERYLQDKETTKSLAIKYNCCTTTVKDSLIKQKIKKATRVYPKFVIPDEDIQFISNRKITLIGYCKLKKITLPTLKRALIRQGITIKGI